MISINEKPRADNNNSCNEKDNARFWNPSRSHQDGSVLVIRNTTERPEAFDAVMVKLVVASIEIGSLILNSYLNEMI